MARGILREETVVVPGKDQEITVQLVWVDAGIGPVGGETIKLIQVASSLDPDGNPVSLSQWEEIVAFDLGRAIGQPEEKQPREFTLTLQRPDQDITVSLRKMFTDQAVYVQWGFDENGNEVDITEEEALSLVARVQAGEDETGL